MNGIRILCDTNPLIYLLDGNRDVAQFLDNKQIYLSVITELEMFGKPNLSVQNIQIIDTLISVCVVIDINKEIRQLYREIKQNHTIKLPDAIVAATAIYLDMPLLTYDRGFRNISNLKLIMLDW